MSAAAPAVAQVEQTAKNGCSSEPYDGSLISPRFTPGPGPTEGPPEVRFEGWFEVESVDLVELDEAVLEYFDPALLEWVRFGRLKDQAVPASAAGAPDQPYSNMGLAVAPEFQSFTFTLPQELQGQVGVRVRFRFFTGDTAFQGFRGVAVDGISIDTMTVDLTEGFENGTNWTPDPASGPGAPSWRILSNPENVTVKNPEVNPDLVTLPDSGALPAAVADTHVAWFGNEASGTYCGPDFANRDAAPETTITGGPPGSTTSTDATLTFESSEAESTFACSLDGTPFEPCTSPQSYSGLSPGTHTFQVQATDPAGNVDPTPASRTWTITQPPPPDTSPPETAVVSGPPAFSEDNTPTFTFASSEPGSRFECSLDGGPFVACSSPYTTARLRGGRHTLSVRAIDAAGNADPTPTVYVFEIALELADLSTPRVGREVNVVTVRGTVRIRLTKGGPSSSSSRRARSRWARTSTPGAAPSSSSAPPVVALRLSLATSARASSRSARSAPAANRGLTDLLLTGGDYGRCRSGGGGSGRGASAARARRLSKKTIRRLNSNADGDFREAAASTPPAPPAAPAGRRSTAATGR
jgi:hypothetical protein